MEGFPVHYSLVVESGLPNSCDSFAGYRIDRQGREIRVEVVNLKPSDPATLCAMVYGTVETRISLGSDFESGEAYTLQVNDMTRDLVAQ